MKRRLLFRVTLVLLLSGNGACSRAAPPPEAPSQPLSAQAEYLFDEGLVLARQGNHLKAEQYLLAAWDAGLTTERVVGPLVESCVTSGRLRSALFHVERARRERPQDPSLMHLAATLHLGLGQLELAALVIDDLRAIEPNYPQALYFLGEYYFGQHQPALARRYLQSFLERYPEAPQAPWVKHLLAQLVEKDVTPIEVSSSLDAGGVQ